VNSRVNSTDAISIGQDTHNNSTEGVTIGKSTNIEWNAKKAVAVGSGALIKTQADNAFALGVGATINEKAADSFAIGTGATILDRAKRSLAIGSGARNNGDDSVVIGTDAYAEKSDSVVIGKGAQTTQSEAVAIGSGSKTTVSKGDRGYDPVQGNTVNLSLTGNTWVSTKAPVSIGDVAGDITRRILSVAAGRDDTDAVNVAQLTRLAEAPVSFGQVNSAYSYVPQVGSLPLARLKFEFEKEMTVKPIKSKSEPEKTEAIRIGVDGNKIDIKKNPTITKLDNDNNLQNQSIRQNEMYVADLRGRMEKVENGWSLHLVGESRELENVGVLPGDDVEIGVADATSGLTVTRETKVNNEGGLQEFGTHTIKFGIDAEKLANNINNAGTTAAISNISAKFNVAGANGANKTAVNLTKGSDHTIQYLGTDGETTVTVGGADNAPTIKFGLADAFKNSVTTNTTNITNLTTRVNEIAQGWGIQAAETGADGVMSKNGSNVVPGKDIVEFGVGYPEADSDGNGLSVTVEVGEEKDGVKYHTVRYDIDGSQLKIGENPFITSLQSGFAVTDGTTNADVTLGGKTKQSVTFKAATDETSDVASSLVASVDANRNVTYTLNTKQLKKDLGISDAGAGTMSSWKLTATGDTQTETVEDGNTVTFDVAEANKGLTVARDGKTIKYGVNAKQMADTVTGDVVTNINAGNTAISNIAAKFSVTDGTTTKAVNMGKDQNNSVKYLGTTDETTVTVGGADNAPTITVGLADAFKTKVTTNTTNIATNTQNITDLQNTAVTALVVGADKNAAAAGIDLTKTASRLDIVGDEDVITTAVAGRTVKVSVNNTNLQNKITNNTTVQKNKTDIAGNTTNIATNTADIGKLKAGFTIKDATTGTSDVTLGGDANQAVTFKAATDETSDVSSSLVASVDANRNVTYTLNTKQLKKDLGISDAGAGTMSSWKLTATGDTQTETVEDGNTVTFDVAEANKGLTVARDGKTIKYGINGSQIDISANQTITDLKTKINAKGDPIYYFSVNSTDNSADSNRNNDGATGADAIAIGKKVSAAGKRSVSIGEGITKNVGKFGIAIGATGNSGEAAPAVKAEHGIAIGSATVADTQGIAIGLNAQNKAGFGTAIGAQSESGYLANAMGYMARAKGNNSLAIGLMSLAKTDDSTAYGRQAQALGDVSLAVGAQASAAGNHSAVFGYQATTDSTASNGIAIGRGAYIGKQAPDGTTPDTGVSNNYYEPKDDDTVVAAGKETMNSTAVGFGAKAFGYQNTALGAGAEAFDTNTIAIGVMSKAIGHYANAMGKQARADGKNAIAVGHWARAIGEGSLAIGDYAITADSDGESAVSKAVALGSHARVGSANSVALGADALAKIADNVATKAYLTDEAFAKTNGVVSVGNAEYTVEGTTVAQNYRRITNLAGGADDNDAVNVAQLKALNTQVGTKITNLETSIDGKIAAAKITVTGDETSGVKVDEVKTGEKVTGYKVSLGDKVKIGDVIINSKDGNSTIGGLTNKTWDPNAITSGQAATEDQLKLVDDKITATNTNVNNKANASLDNITDGGKNVVRDLAKEAVKVGNGTNTTVETVTDGNATVYKVNVADSVIKDKAQEAVKVQAADGEKNLTVTADTTTTPGATIYNIRLGNKVTLGTDAAKQITIDGTTGKASFGGGNIAIDGAAQTLTVGKGDKQISLNGETGAASFGKVNVNGDAGTIGGLTNRTRKTEDFATVGRAATEEQLKELGDEVGTKITNLETSIDGKIEAAKITVTGDETSGVKVEEVKTGDKVTGYKVGLGDKVKVGDITINSKDGNSTVSGLTNKTLNVEGFATSGRAATEEQLKAAMDAAAAQGKTTVKAGDNITVTTDEQTNTYTVSMVKDITADSVTVGKTTLTDAGVSYDGKTYIGKEGLNANGKKVTNVVAGDVSKTSTDAVNGAQLFATNENVAANTKQLANINQAIGKQHQAIRALTEESREGDALSGALAALKPLDFDPLQRSQIMAGLSTYRGKQAVALGIAHYTSEDTMWHGGISYAGTSHLMANVGISWRFGDKEDNDIRKERERLMPQYAQGPISSVYVLQDEVQSLQRENQSIRQENADIREQNKEANARIAQLEQRLDALMAKLQ